jgi:hypothetical protein
MEVNDLITEIAESGREATDDEITRIRVHVAGVGFEPGGWTKAGIPIAGLSWEGHIVRSSDRMENAIVHFLRHTVAQREWPEGTTLDEYIASLRQATQYADGGITLERQHQQWRLSFISRAYGAAGPDSGGWILVGYPLEYGYWSTGFQPEFGLRHVILNTAEGERWLCKPLTQNT